MPYLSARCQRRVGSYCYIPSWSLLKTDATRDPRWVMFIRIGEPLGLRRLESLSRVAG
jgi:hypothetical protein